MTGQDSDGDAARRVAPKDVRRNQLMDAAMVVIAEMGVTGATAAAVTSEAGLSAGIISLHFDGMQGLLTETLRRLAIEKCNHWAAAYADSDASLADRLRRTVDAMFAAQICTPEKLAVWYAFFGETRYRQVYNRVCDEFNQDREKALRELCELIVADGGFTSVDCAMLAANIEALVDGLWLSLLLFPDLLDAEGANDQLMGMISAHLPGYFPDHALKARTDDGDP